MKQQSIPPPNYTQVPNALFALMPEMEKSELKVVLAVCRMTAGWHKPKDRLTVTRLMDLTGLSRQAVYDGIELAKTRGILLQEETEQDGYIYSLNITDEVSSEETPSVYSGDTPVSSEETPSTQPVDTQKKVQKKTVKKEISKESGGDSEVYSLSPPNPDQNGFAALIKDMETRFERLTPRRVQEIGELWDDYPDLDAHIAAMDATDKYASGFNLKYYESCLSSWWMKHKRGKHVKPSQTVESGNGDGRDRGDGRNHAPLGERGTRAAQPPAGNAHAKQIPRVPR